MIVLSPAGAHDRVEVPRSTGPDSERAIWKLNGALRITTSDKNNRGSITGSGA